MVRKTLWDYLLAEEASADATAAGNIAASISPTCERTSKRAFKSSINTPSSKTKKVRKKKEI